MSAAVDLGGLFYTVDGNITPLEEKLKSLEERLTSITVNLDLSTTAAETQYDVFATRLRSEPIVVPIILDTTGAMAQMGVLNAGGIGAVEANVGIGAGANAATAEGAAFESFAAGSVLGSGANTAQAAEEEVEESVAARSASVGRYSGGGYLGTHLGLMVAYHGVREAFNAYEDAQKFNEIGDEEGDTLTKAKKELAQLKKEEHSGYNMLKTSLEAIGDAFQGPMTPEEQKRRDETDIHAQVIEKQREIDLAEMQEKHIHQLQKDARDQEKEREQTDRIKEVRDSTARIIRGDRYASEEDKVESITDRAEEAIQRGINEGAKTHSRAPVVEGANLAQLGIADLERMRAIVTSPHGTKEFDPLYTNTAASNDDQAALLKSIDSSIKEIVDTIGKLELGAVGS
jgi:hypothetical protein